MPYQCAIRLSFGWYQLKIWMNAHVNLWVTLIVHSNTIAHVTLQPDPTQKITQPLNMSPVFPVFHTVTTVSWPQKHMQNDNVHSTILDVYVLEVWHLKIPFSAELCKPKKNMSFLGIEHSTSFIDKFQKKILNFASIFLLFLSFSAFLLKKHWQSIIRPAFGLRNVQCPNAGQNIQHRMPLI